MSTPVTTRPQQSPDVGGQLSFLFAEPPAPPPAPPPAIPAPTPSIPTAPEADTPWGQPPAATSMPAAADPASAPPATLADVAALLSSRLLHKGKLAEAQSAIRVIGRVLHRPLSAIPADPFALRPLIASATPGTAGITLNRWNRSRSLLSRALAATGIDVMPGRSTGGLSPSWSALYSRLPSKKLRYGLSRILSFLSTEGVEPDAVNQTSFDRFADALRTSSLHPSPETAIRTTGRLWIAAVNQVPGWPRLAPKLDPTGRSYSLPMNAFPASFIEDAEAFLQHSGNPDVLADDYAPPVAAGTIVLRRGQIRQIASALVHSGFPIERVTGLAVLAEPANAKAALRYLLDRKGGTTTPYLGQQAHLLRVIAKYRVKVAPADLATITAYASGLSTKKQKGMTAKNRERLRQFDLPENVRKLLTMPARVFDELRKAKARGQKLTRRDALRAMLALVAQILIISQMRLDNFAGLHLERHIVRHRRGRAMTVHIVIPPRGDQNRRAARMPAERGNHPAAGRIPRRLPPPRQPEGECVAVSQ